MKTRIILGAILLIFLSIFVLQGSAIFNRDSVITIYDGKNIILKKTYKIDTKTLLKTKILHKGSYKRLYDKLAEKDPNLLEQINKDLSKDVLALPKKYDKKPIDAKVKYLGNGKFIYQMEEIGYTINVDKVVKAIFYALDSDGKVQLAKDYITPEISKKHLEESTQKIAEFSTSFAGSSAQRKHNIALACKKIDGSIVQSLDEFSFNETVGPRTEKAGFKVAKIILSGEFVAGVGGGVCQVSSTLYNAWCLSGLKVLKSATHSLPVRYVSPGLDAMVASSSDLVLLNDSDSAVYIDAKCIGATVKFTLYGKPCGFVVKLKSEVLEILSTNQYVEEKIEITDWKEEEIFRIIRKPKDGLVSASYREFYDNDGNLIYKERLRKTVYLAQKGKIVYKYSINSQAS